MEFYIDENRNQFNKVSVVYIPEHHISRLIVIFNVIDYDYKTVKLKKDLLLQVFNEKGEILSKYKNYKLLHK